MRITTDFGIGYGRSDMMKRNRKIEETMEKLASGTKINKAADDTGNIRGIETKKARINGTSKANENINMGIDLMRMADKGLGQIENVLQRMRELAIQSKNGIYTDEDRSFLAEEFNELKHSIDKITDSFEYNHLKVLQPPSLTKGAGTQRADIVFIVDNTASMAPIQTQVASSLNDFVNSLTGGGVTDSQFGVIEYTDNTYDVKNFGGSEWTTSTTDIANTLNAMSSTNNGGTENLMEAINQTIANYGFRPNDPNTVNRHVIFVTNEDADDDANFASTLANLQANGIQVHGVFYKNNSDTGELHGLVSGTNGQSVNLSDPSWGMELGTQVGGQIVNSTGKGNGVTIHIGAEANDAIDIKMLDARSQKIGIDAAFIDTFANAESAVMSIDGVIENILTYRSDYGAMENRLKETLRNNESFKQNMTESLSKVRDTDMAEEMSEMTKNKIAQSGAFFLHKNALENGKTFAEILFK